MGLQEQINAIPIGGTGTLTPGTYAEALDVDLQGRTVVATGVTNKARTRFHNGTIRFFRVAEVRNMLQNEQAALTFGSNTTAMGCIAEHNTGQGWAAIGDNITLIDCVGGRNGHNGGGATRCKNLRVSGGYLANNNRGLADPPWKSHSAAKLINGLYYVDPGWEAGGMKTSYCDGLIIQDVEAYDNGGPGIWPDHENYNYLIEGCHVHHNKGVTATWQGIGISTEINRGAGIIRDNYCHDNDAGGIEIWETSNVTVEGNVLDGDGLNFRNINRAPFKCANVTLRNNKLYNGSKINYWSGMDAAYRTANAIIDQGTQYLTGTPVWDGTTEEPPMPIDPVPANAVYLSDLTPISQSNGYGPIGIDKSNGEIAAGDGRQLSIGGVKFAKGLGVHAPSKITYKLDGKYKTFVAYFGVDDEVGTRGSVNGIVRVGSLTELTGVMRGGNPPDKFDIDVAGKSELTLEVTDAGDGIAYDHADWGLAYLIPADVVPPPAPTIEDAVIPITLSGTVKVGVRDGKIVVVP